MTDSAHSGPIIVFPRATQGALFLAILTCCVVVSWAQNAPAPQAQAPTSLGDSLKRVRTENTQLHILYVHGMAASGPGVSASLDLRKSICKFLRDCTTLVGEPDGIDYADRKDFALNAPPPNLQYLGHPLWKTDANGSSEEWNASAPFVDHYKLERKNAPTIYVDEINWWPLVFAPKCRQIVAEDASLAGPIKTYIHTCSLPATPDPKHPGRFRAYPFLSNEQALTNLPPKGARLNRSLKTFLLDWGFADAVLAVGPMRSLFLEGIGELVLKSVSVAADGSRGDTVPPAPNQEFVIVSHSLGSYLMFSALDIQSNSMEALIPEDRKATVDRVLSNTSEAYFLANQVRLLELANLDAAKDLTTHLRTWSSLRIAARKPVPQIVAWSDPSDLLTWSVPQLDPSVVVVLNLPVKNAHHWFWLVENPIKAHSRYDQNNRVIQAMLPKAKHGQEE